ncbi:MAG: DASS family sodium-coupled anion symporter [Verrucomicrobiota bacterium]
MAVHWTDTRAQAKRFLEEHRLSPSKSAMKMLVCGVLALGVRWWAEASFDELSVEGGRMVGVLVFAAGLWVTEAIPAFAVALLVMALNIFALTPTGGSEVTTWPQVLAPWASPILWLFFGGFVLAGAASKVGLDRRMAAGVMRRFSQGPGILLGGLMGLTALLSMFVSNTATAAMMVAMLGPVLAGREERLGKALLLGVALAASLGGMGSVIGSPPNAIAVSSLEGGVSFFGWMVMGLPPAVVLLVLGWVFLRWRYLRDLPWEAIEIQEGETEGARDRLFVGVILFGTVGLWMTEAWHGMHPALVAFFGVTVLTVRSTVTSADLRKVPWEVLLMMAGGLALGKGIEGSGLAAVLSDLLPLSGGAGLLILGACGLAVILSNVMSNTAAAALLIPLFGSLSVFEGAEVAIPVALVCSCATCLPVSTPPNAIAFATGRLASRDFMAPGLGLIVLGPVVVNLWLGLVG